MKIIHTSDWHIGRNLYNKKQYDIHEQFLNWLQTYILDNEVKLLLVSGDVFDTGTPSNRAQELYYQFLCNISSQCTAIITGGNHDSPSFLNAPKEILKNLNIHIFGAATSQPENQIVHLENGVIVCAVPYLRERDVRVSTFGENDDERTTETLAGIKNFYNNVLSVARKIDQNLPVIVMGHLFTAGGKVQEGDGVRELYVGNLNRVRTDIFSDDIDYLALGHLHSHQKVGDKPHFRYSGSPIKMSFSEANQTKYIIELETAENNIEQITPVPIPEFQKLSSITGDFETIKKRIEALKSQEESVWLEIIYNGQRSFDNLQVRINKLITGSPLEVLRIKDMNIYNQVSQQESEQDLKTISETEVFDKCLAANLIDDDQKKELKEMYCKVLRDVTDSE